MAMYLMFLSMEGYAEPENPNSILLITSRTRSDSHQVQLVENVIRLLSYVVFAIHVSNNSQHIMCQFRNIIAFLPFFTAFKESLNTNLVHLLMFICQPLLFRSLLFCRNTYVMPEDLVVVPYDFL